MLDTIKSQLTGEHEADNKDSTEQESENASRTVADKPEGENTPMRADTQAAVHQETPIELDEVFGLLKNQRRRDVLRHLVENDSEVRLGELAEQIAARECGKDVSQIDSQERKRVYVGLYQCHLPKLADVGAITYNKPRGIIERGPNFDQISRYLPATETTAGQDASDRRLLESFSNYLSAGRFFR